MNTTKWLENTRFVTQTVLACLVLYAAVASSGTLYKCQSESGKLLYKDTPCLGKDEQISKKKVASVGPNSDLENVQSGAKLVISNQDFQAVLVQVTSTLQIVKISIMEYYFMHGEWPENLASIEFNAAAMTSTNIEQVQLGDRGNITTLLAPKIGSNIIVEITPHLVMDQTSIEWEYTTNASADFPVPTPLDQGVIIN